MKVCPVCTRNLQESDFNINRSKPDGLQNKCRECQKRGHKEWYEKNREHKLAKTRENSLVTITKNRELMFSVLEGESCSMCGETDPIVLEFDHVENKIADVSKMVASGWPTHRVEREIEKCQVLCANCHKRKTHEEQNTARWNHFTT